MENAAAPSTQMFPHQSQNSRLDRKTPGATDLSKPHVDCVTLDHHSERLDSAVLDIFSFQKYNASRCKVSTLGKRKQMCSGNDDGIIILIMLLYDIYKNCSSYVILLPL